MSERQLTADWLLARGFEEVGVWKILGNLLSAPAGLPDSGGVYAYAIGNLVQYVGVASRSLRKRLSFYCRPGATQSTNIRINKLIRDLIDQGAQVRVLAATPPELEWNGMRVCGSSGLEAGLIKDFDLPWNKRGVASLLPKVAARPTERPEALGPSAPINPVGAGAIQRAIIEHIGKQPGCTEREMAQALFGRNGVQQQVNGHCRELVRRGILLRLPTTPITYQLGKGARTA